MNSVPLWLIIVAEKLTLAVYGNKTTESRGRTEDERTETTIPEAIGGTFLGWMERNSERLSELCDSVVNNRIYLIKLFKQPIANLLIPYRSIQYKRIYGCQLQESPDLHTFHSLKIPIVGCNTVYFINFHRSSINCIIGQQSIS